MSNYRISRLPNIDVDNELKHFEWEDHKYKDKVKTASGKWRYIYENTKKKAKDTIADAVGRTKDKLGYDEKDRLNKAVQEYDKVKTTWGGNDDTDEDSSKINAAASVAKTVAKARKEYENTPLSKLDKLADTVEKGKQKVSNLFGPKESAIDTYYREQSDKQEAAKRREEYADARDRGFRNIEDKNEYYFESDVFKRTKPAESFDDLKKLPTNMFNDTDRALINPYYKTDMAFDNDEYTTNCSYCTAAYDMRQRGYDVRAAAIDNTKDDPTTLDELMSWYPGCEAKQSGDVVKEHLGEDVSASFADPKQVANAFEQDMLKHGDGSRGFFIAYWKEGSAHAIAWEVENGEVVLRDCQINKNRTVEEIVERSSVNVYFRTDNIEPSEEILKTVRNRTTSRRAL